MLGGEELTGHVGAQTRPFPRMALASRREARRLLEGDPPGYFQREWAHVVVEDFERGTEQGHVLIVAFGEAWPFQLLLAELGQRMQTGNRTAPAPSAVTPSPVARPSIPAIPEPIHPPGVSPRSA